MHRMYLDNEEQAVEQEEIERRIKLLDNLKFRWNMQESHQKGGDDYETAEESKGKRDSQEGLAGGDTDAYSSSGTDSDPEIII